MSRSRRKVLVRCAVAALAALVMFAATSLPASADGDGYIDNWQGDTISTLSTWNLNSQQYVVVNSSTTPGNIRQSFDDAWAGLSASFCDELEAGIKAGDGGWDGRNRCTPVTADQAELRAKTLGTNLVGLRYFIPGHDGIEYAFNHKTCVIFCFDTNIDVSFDLTLDVALRFAPGVGKDPDITTPASVQSASLSFSNSYFRATACTASCHQGELQLNSTVEDVSNRIDLTGTNTDIHTKLPLSGYYGLSASVDSTALDLGFRLDSLPKIDPAKGLASVSYTDHVGNLLIPTVQLYGVDMLGQLWRQTSAFGVWSHWANLQKPTGTTIASGPAAVVGADGQPVVVATGANGHLYEYAAAKWIDRGHPTGTTAVGTPAVTRSGTVISAVVRGANGHLGLVHSTATPWPWLDLGTVATTVTPTVIALFDYVGVVVTSPSGEALWLRESSAGVWRPWRRLGTLPAKAVTAPALQLGGGAINAYVTGANQQIFQTSFKPFGAATITTVASFFASFPLPPVVSAPAVASMPNGDPVIFATDTSGNVEHFAPVVSRGRRFFYSVNSGTLLGSTMAAPAAVAANGSVTGFAVAGNGHVGETHVSGTHNGLIDHDAVSRVVYQGHGSLGRRQIWSPVVQEGQNSTLTGIDPLGLHYDLDALLLQSTGGGALRCQAYADGVGWLPEVDDSQWCGSSGHGLRAVRLRLTDGPPGLHVLYRCRRLLGLVAGDGTWTPWVADGTACGATDGVNTPIKDIQVQYTDAPLAAASSRVSAGSGFWQGWADEGAVMGTAGVALEAGEFHSSVGGQLKCQAYVSDAVNSQVHDAGWRAQVDDSAVCGTVGEGRHLEGFTLQLVGAPPGESVSYRAYVSGSGWGPWVSDGQIAGVVGQGQAVQAIQFLTNPYT